MEPKKKSNKLVNIVREMQTHRYKEQTRVSSGEGGAQRRGSTGPGGEGTKLLGVRQATRSVPYNTRTTVSIL